MSVWVVLTALIVGHTKEVGVYLDHLGRLGLRGAAEPSTPLKSPVFSFAADAQTWIRYALQLEEGDQVQLRYTHIDNAPNGREVHWNSAWAWAIAGAGKVRQMATGEPLPTATERAALWLNLFALMAFVTVYSAWVARRAGVVSAIVVALGMVGSARFYEGFLPSYVDHHGLLTASAFGLVLGAVFMGAGWWQEGDGKLIPRSAKQARSAAVFSAVCGAIGIWVSAASAVPPIALVGLSALGATLIVGRGAQLRGASFDGESWRIWGRVGAAFSFFFYLLEYAPHHLGMRLEVNHPLYALAWWAGGELIASLGELWVERRMPDQRRGRRLLLCTLALSIVPLLIIVAGPRVFLLRDPFLAELHHNILEFLSLPRRIKMSGWHEVTALTTWEFVPLVLLIGYLGWRRAKASVIVWFTVLAGLAFIAMGIWQERWLLNASGPSICALLVLCVILAAEFRFGRSPAVPMIGAALLFGIPAVTRIFDIRRIADGAVIANKDAFQALFRDVATSLRASQPEGDIVLLSSPNSSTGIGYYGRFQTTGTLYWENDEGLKTAARIFSAESDDEAAKLIREHRITHIAMILEENFIGQYYALLHPGAKQGDLQKCFGYRLLVSEQFPAWLQVLPYVIPPDLKSLNQKVLLFKVAFDQTEADAVYHLGVAQVAWGQLEAAEKSFGLLAEMVPNVPQPWLRKTEVLITEKKWPEAMASADKGISLAAAAERPKLYASAGKTFYENGAAAAAVAMYRKALSYSFDPGAAFSLSWILSTSKDATVRNGPEALQLAQAVVKSDPNSGAYLSALAAALAENGRMAEAAAVAEQATAHSGPDAASIEAAKQRLAAYRAGQPWRE